MEARRIALIVGGIALAVVLFLAFRPGDDDTPETAETAATTAPSATETAAATTTAPAPPPPPAAAPRTPVERITIEGGRIAGGLRQITVARGEKVTLVVVSDVPDTVHVHGVDLMRDVGPGRVARLTFAAEAAGRYEVELEDAGLQVAQLNVEPG